MQKLLSDPYTLLAIILLAAGCAFGVIFERVVMGRLRRMAQQSASRLDDVVLDALKGVTMAGFSLLGLYGAIVTLPRSPLTDRFHKLLLIVTVAYCTMVVARLAVAYINHYARQVQGVLPSTSIFGNLARAVIYVIGFLVILESLDYKITPILTALGVGGLAVALALQDTLSNLFSGLQIIGSRQVRPGDFIQLESGEEGYVIDVTWRNTTIREPANNTIIVPNSKLASSRVRNFYQPDKELAIPVEVSVSCDSDLEQVERVTMEVARQIMKTVSGAVPEAEPTVLYTKFQDSSVNLVAVLRGQEAAYRGALRHAFLKRIHERFKQEGIEIPSPARTVYMKQSP
jgi:small-conductance mechanosensitive channel